MTKTRIELLDHGYIQLVETWGSDGRIIEAARMSTAKGFLGWGPTGECCPTERTQERCVRGVTGCIQAHGQGDEKLLAYLYENHHATPFEMAGAVVEVKAPIAVFREWHRHRTQSYNEMSARYVPLPDENYIPSIDRLLMNSKTNKQAGVIKGAAELDRIGAMAYRNALAAAYRSDQLLYESALASGVPKDLARMHLPVGRYSCMRASANLRNWLAFLTLRMAEGAQWEIRQYANALSAILAEVFPRTHTLFVAGLAR